MKRDVTRTIGEKNRKIGAAPDIGRVLRSHQSGATNKRGAPTAAGRRRRKNCTLMAWSVVFAVVSVGIVMFFVISHFRDLASAPVEAIGLAPGSADLDEFFFENNGQETDTPGEETSLEFVTSALSNRDPDAVEKFFKLPSEKSHEDAIRILKEIEAREGTVSKTNWLGTAFANGNLMNQVIVHTEKDGHTVNRLAQIVPQPDGEWRIDFDSYTRATSAGWEVSSPGNPRFQKCGYSSPPINITTASSPTTPSGRHTPWSPRTPMKPSTPTRNGEPRNTWPWERSSNPKSISTALHWKSPPSRMQGNASSKSPESSPRTG